MFSVVDFPSFAEVQKRITRGCLKEGGNCVFGNVSSRKDIKTGVKFPIFTI